MGGRCFGFLPPHWMSIIGVDIPPSCCQVGILESGHVLLSPNNYGSNKALQFQMSPEVFSSEYALVERLCNCRITTFLALVFMALAQCPEWLHCTCPGAHEQIKESGGLKVNSNCDENADGITVRTALVLAGIIQSQTTASDLWRSEWTSFEEDRCPKGP